MEVIVKKRAGEVARFIQTIIARGDADRDALGFLPRGAYFDAARQEKLLVAVTFREGSEIYVGHLLFGGAFPHLRIFQVFVEQPYRRTGVASQLIDAIIKEGEDNRYLTVSARVADDLVQANAFWEQKGFDVNRAVRGGPSSTRVVNVRTRYLNTPTLFNTAGSTPQGARDLQLIERTPSASPTFSLDLNVLLDLVEKRSGAADVSQVIGAAMSNVVRLFVAQEFITELNRSHNPGSRDPVLEFARSLPQFPAVPPPVAARLKLELSSIIFPERARRGQLRLREQSDLLHLAAAIHNKVQGFITNDQALLRRRTSLQAKYRIDVIGVAEVARLLCADPHMPPADVATSGRGGEVQVSRLDEPDLHLIERFLKDIKISDSTVHEVLSTGPVSSPRRRFCAFCDGKLVGFASWDSPQRIREVDISIFVDDFHPSARSTADYLLDVAVRDACVGGPAVLRLINLSTGASALEIAIARGFRRPHGDPRTRSGVLKKISIGQVVGSDVFQSVRSEIKRLVQVQLPQELPTYVDSVTPICVTNPQGTDVIVSLEELENLMGPVLFILPGRNCAIVPIRTNYADELLRARPQRGLFPRKEASLFSERVYYSDPRTASVLTPGTLIIFYESLKDEGLGAAIACARVVRSGLAVGREISLETRRRGVLDTEKFEQLGPSEMRNLTFFDNIMTFANPVSLEKLREIGCWDKSNLVTSRPISGENFQLIVKEGHPNATLY